MKPRTAFWLTGILTIACFAILGFGVGAVAGNTEKPVGDAVLAVISGLFGAAVAQLFLRQAWNVEVDSAISKLAYLPENDRDTLKRELRADQIAPAVMLIAILSVSAFFGGGFAGLKSVPWIRAGSSPTLDVIVKALPPDIGKRFEAMDSKQRFELNTAYLSCRQMNFSLEETSEIIKSLINYNDGKQGSIPVLSKYLFDKAVIKSGGTFGAP
jgi:hypothetical protein